MLTHNGSGEICNIAGLNVGLVHAEATVVIPTYYCTMSLMSSLQGLALFSLFQEFTLHTALAFSIGICACLLGVVMISLRVEPEGTGRNKDAGMSEDLLDVNRLADSVSDSVREDSETQGSDSSYM